MKKVLVLFLMLTVLLVSTAQNPDVYEKKEIITADSVKAGTLYVRTLEALSDWAGSQKRSKANVDVQDKDEGLVVYKGKLYLGFVKQNMLYGWDAFADFTLKVRCKNGKAQITMTIPSLTYHWSAENSADTTVPICEVYPQFCYKGEKSIKKTSLALTPTIPKCVAEVINNIGERIAKGNEDDF